MSLRTAAFHQDIAWALLYGLALCFDIFYTVFIFIRLFIQVWVCSWISGIRKRIYRFAVIDSSIDLFSSCRIAINICFHSILCDQCIIADA